MLQLIDPEQGVTVVFQVLVSPSFLQDQEKGNVIIRAGGQDLGHWRLSCVDMHPVGYVLLFIVYSCYLILIYIIFCNIM